MNDWEEDWETGETTTPPSNNCKSLVDEKNSLSIGKIFGSRGRGFVSPGQLKLVSKVGRRPLKHENGDHENRKVKGDQLESNGKGRRRKDDSFKKKDYDGKDGGDEPKSKPKSTYIPEEPSEDDNEIFGNGITTGINFSKYDDIEVRVSGENSPRAIKNFESAGLNSFLVGLIKKCNYNKPTPIQKYSIPIIMEGRDMMACAQTGSGKTAAFLIPIINTLLENREKEESKGCCPQAVIVSPTRELTIQIFNEARKFSRGSFLKIAISYGGTAMFHQIKTVQKGCHILVATPGRLLDFVRRGTVKLSNVKFVVLDEADRMLDLGFLSDMETLLSHEALSSSERQTLMFSATFPEEIQRLAGKFLKNYLFVAVGIVGGACADVEQRVFCVTKFEKRNKVVELLSKTAGSKCLIFVEQKRTTDFIATFLCEKNFPATSIHGDREQKEREEALKDFKSGKMHILVATSIAARGLDIKDVAHVVNFDLPKSIDEYVHRIGRTGRVGNRGLATSFYDPERDRLLAPDLVRVLQQTGQAVPDFLKNSDFGTDYELPSKFGGSDFRQKDIGSARGTTYEEEEW